MANREFHDRIDIALNAAPIIALIEGRQLRARVQQIRKKMNLIVKAVEILIKEMEAKNVSS